MSQSKKLDRPDNDEFFFVIDSKFKRDLSKPCFLFSSDMKPGNELRRKVALIQT